MTDLNSHSDQRRYALHATRIAIFVLIIVLIHRQHQRLTAKHLETLTDVQVEQVVGLFPAASQVRSVGQDGQHEVLNENNETLGFVVQTSPASDHLIGFSGPTNVLIGFGTDDRILGIKILGSRDTAEHVAQVEQDARFMQAFDSSSWKEASQLEVDSVSGATLTSFAIVESIIHRLGGTQPNLRFPQPPTLEEAHGFFPQAKELAVDSRHSAIWHVLDSSGEELGTIFRTSPFADHLNGYQGPTEVRVYFGGNGKAIGISLGKSYDNDEYVKYVRDDAYFKSLFNDYSLEQLSTLDLEEAEVEGVSGATMTSMAVADSIIAAALKQHEALSMPPVAEETPAKKAWIVSARDVGTILVVVFGAAVALTRLRGKRFLRILFQLVLIGYLGLTNGDMVSQALLVGWAQNGVPWTSAFGLAALTMAALVLPMTTGRNVYCSHLCPHGAAQDLLRNRLGIRVRPTRWLSASLKCIPPLLLVWVVVVAMTMLPFSLVHIEPFDGWVFRISGWASITIAIVGLVASAFSPMAYCRYGCPTGALLGYLRLHRRSDRWGRSDWVAIALVGLALCL